LIDVAYTAAFPQTEDAHAQAVATLSSTVTELRVDGVLLVLDQTAIKRIDPASTEQLFGPDMAGFWLHVGALSVGAHTLQLTAPFNLPPKTFFIDPSDSTTCS
jgi:hypothetical protein